MRKGMAGLFMLLSTIALSQAKKKGCRCIRIRAPCKHINPFRNRECKKMNGGLIPFFAFSLIPAVRSLPLNKATQRLGLLC
jgi:hypothetical protein